MLPASGDMKSRLPWSIAGIDFCAFALTKRIRCLRALRKESLNRRFVSDSLVQKSQGKKKNQRPHLQIKGKYFMKRAAITKIFKWKKLFFLMRDALFEHRPSGLAGILNLHLYAASPWSQIIARHSKLLFIQILHNSSVLILISFNFMSVCVSMILVSSLPPRS